MHNITSQAVQSLYWKVVKLEQTADCPSSKKEYYKSWPRRQNGVGVVLEHRYYGTSFPTANLSTESLRFLTTEQALADTAYFARHVRFKGLEQYGANLTAPKTAYIAYGGSYAGAFVAFLRKTYPHVYYGAIASSGVTEAIWDYWQYYSPVAEYGKGLADSKNLQMLIL